MVVEEIPGIMLRTRLPVNKAKIAGELVLSFDRIVDYHRGIEFIQDSSSR